MFMERVQENHKVRVSSVATAADPPIPFENVEIIFELHLMIIGNACTLVWDMQQTLSDCDCGSVDSTGLGLSLATNQTPSSSSQCWFLIDLCPMHFGCGRSKVVKHTQHQVPQCGTTHQGRNRWRTAHGQWQAPVTSVPIADG